MCTIIRIKYFEDDLIIRIQTIGSHNSNQVYNSDTYLDFKFYSIYFIIQEKKTHSNFLVRLILNLSIYEQREKIDHFGRHYF